MSWVLIFAVALSLVLLSEEAQGLPELAQVPVTAGSPRMARNALGETMRPRIRVPKLVEPLLVNPSTFR